VNAGRVVATWTRERVEMHPLWEGGRPLPKRGEAVDVLKVYRGPASLRGRWTFVEETADGLWLLERETTS